MVQYMKYEQYRDSGVEWIGEVPEEWEIKRLKYIANVQLSNVDKKSVDGELPVLLCNYVDVYYNDTISDDLDFMQATAKCDQIKRFKLRKNDVLITKDSESPNDIAIPAWVQRDFEDVLCGYHLAHIRPFETMNGRYLFYCFDSIRIREQYYALANGVTRFGLSKDDINCALFYVPNIDEQTQIANFLDLKTAEIDSLIADKEKLITLLEEQRQAIITEAVTKGLNPNVKMKDSGVEWIGEIPEGWSVKKLKFFVRIFGGGTPSKEFAEYWNGDIPWVSPKDMKSEEIDSTEDYITEDGLYNSTTVLIKEKAILIVVRSGILKRYLPIATNKVPVTINQDMKAIIPYKYVTVDYLAWYMKGISNFILFSCKKDGATVDSIESDDLQNLVVSFPDMEEQVAIVDFLHEKISEIDTLKSDIQIQINKLKEYRQSLILEAITGKFDVRDVAVESIVTA